MENQFNTRMIDTVIMADSYQINTRDGIVCFQAGHRYRLLELHGHGAKYNLEAELAYGNHRYFIPYNYVAELSPIPESDAHLISARSPLVYVSCCEEGPNEVERLGPFESVELGTDGILLTHKDGSDEWNEVDVSEYAHVFIEGADL